MDAMTATDIALPSTANGLRRADNISQTTAIEQARAVAEVQAQVIVAQQVPRDIMRARAEMQTACGRMSLASRAFYSVPNRGNGPSVHLARELARIWQNLNYGVHELRRDDAAGISEIQAFAWDMQANTRSTRTFIVPHERMVKINGKPTRQQLVDLGDIYLSNQNVGARAVRECIFSILPNEFTEEAEALCHRTLKDGDGKPIEERIEGMVSAFRGIDVSVAQIEKRLGKARGKWDPGDVAQMLIVYKSITSDGISKAEEFPPLRVTVDDLPAAQERGAGGAADRETVGSVEQAAAQPRGGDAPPAPDQRPPDALSLYGDVTQPNCAEWGVERWKEFIRLHGTTQLIVLRHASILAEAAGVEPPTALSAIGPSGFAPALVAWVEGGMK